MSDHQNIKINTINKNAKKIFEQVTNLVFAVILFFITLTILIGTFRLFYRLADLFKSAGITGEYLYIFTDVLTLFILIELSRSIYEYISVRKLRLTLVIDAAIVFILRDIMIELFKHSLTNQTAYALSALLFVLGAIRFGIIYGEQKKYAD